MKLTTLLPCLMVILAVAQGIEAVQLKRCADFQGEGLFDIEKFEVTPDPLVSGKAAKAHIVGDLKEPIDNTIKISGTMQYLFLSIPIPKRNLCAYLEECPIEPGKVDLSETQQVDDNLPKGTYTGKIDVTRGADVLDCFELEALTVA